MANRIDEKFRLAESLGKTVLTPFVTVGYPDLATSEEVAAALLDSGDVLLELGVPFSDPLAEGPTIQKTSHRALQQGVTVRTCLATVRRLRERDAGAPLILMGYFNPYLRYGLEKLVSDSAAAGVDGLIVPDLPLEEAGAFQHLCDNHGLYLIPMLAPTSTDERIARACKHAKGFIYCVSLTGVTGARPGFRFGAVAGLVGKIRLHTSLPVLVGFGVSRREHVEEITRFADGAVVGSALLDAVGKVPKEEAAQEASNFLKSLRG